MYNSAREAWILCKAEIIFWPCEFEQLPEAGSVPSHSRTFPLATLLRKSSVKIGGCAAASFQSWAQAFALPGIYNTVSASTPLIQASFSQDPKQASTPAIPPLHS